MAERIHHPAEAVAAERVAGSKRLRGKLHPLLEQIDQGHHVFRACAKSGVLRMYQKGSTFLRLEVLSNRLTEFGLRKSLDHLDAVRHTLAAVTDRFAAFEATALNVLVDFPLFQHLALPNRHRTRERPPASRFTTPAWST